MEKLIKSSENTPIVIDASGLILGRLASYSAKYILNGKNVLIINSEKAIISGKKEQIVEDFKKKLGTRTLQSQKKAPKHQRRPDTYLRRVVRGMLPWKKPKGKMAFKRLKVYIGAPENLIGLVKQIPEAKKNVQPYMTVGELLSTFGWKI